MHHDLMMMDGHALVCSQQWCHEANEGKEKRVLGWWAAATVGGCES
jgi:hypothetical protein